MENELAELKHRIDALAVDGRGRRIYTSPVKRDVIAYVKKRLGEKASQGAVSRELGIHQATLSEWTGARGKKKKTSRRVRRVEVTEGSRATEPVVHVAGLRIEGLSIAQVAELAKALS